MYKVQQYHEKLGWTDIMFTESKTVGYCHGYVDAYDSFYPSPPVRIVKGDKVIRETKGRSKVEVS